MTPTHSHPVSVEELIEAYESGIDMTTCAGCRQKVSADEKPAVVSYWERADRKMFYRVCHSCVGRCTSEKHLRRLARAVEKYLEPDGVPS